MNNNSNNCGDCGTTCSECGRPWAICKQDGGCGCNKCKDIKFCEYGRMANGCIREKQPGCPMQAVIPSVTVESIEGIKNLADCLVHVSDINTTFYIDDKHRPIITWAGPIDIPGYDMEGNPNNYRDQIVTDVANQEAVIYDKSGRGYVFGLVENIDLQDQIDNKLDEMAEDGTLQEIIADYLNMGAVWGYDSIADMKAATNLTNGSSALTKGYYNAGDGGSALYRITDTVPSGYYETLNNGLYAQLVDDKINVKQAGAKGDGLTDDTTAIRNAIAFCKANGVSELVIPDGEFVVSDTLTIDFSNLTLKGSEGGILKYVGEGAGTASAAISLISLAGENADEPIENIRIDGVNIDATSQVYKGGNTLETPRVTSTNPCAKGLRAIVGGHVKNLIISNCKFNDIYGDGIVLYYSENCKILNNTLRDVSSGNITYNGQTGYDDHGDAIVAFSSHDVIFDGNTVINTRVYQHGMTAAIGKPCGRSGLEFEYQINVNYANNNPDDVAHNAPDYGLVPTVTIGTSQIRQAYAMRMSNNYIYGYTKAIHLESHVKCLIVNNNLLSSHVGVMASIDSGSVFSGNYINPLGVGKAPQTGYDLYYSGIAISEYAGANERRYGVIVTGNVFEGEGRGVILGSKNVTITNNIFKTEYGVYTQVTNLSGIVITNNTFNNHGLSNPQNPLYLYRVSSAIIKENQFFSDNDKSIAISGNNLQISNNILENVRIYHDFGGSNITVKDNIFKGNNRTDSVLYIATPTSATIEGNSFYADSASYDNLTIVQVYGQCNKSLFANNKFYLAESRGNKIVVYFDGNLRDSKLIGNYAYGTTSVSRLFVFYVANRNIIKNNVLENDRGYVAYCTGNFRDWHVVEHNQGKIYSTGFYPNQSLDKLAGDYYNTSDKYYKYNITPSSTTIGWICTASGYYVTTSWSSSEIATGSIIKNQNNNVYRCITKGSGASTVEPTHTTSENVTESDGYTWEYLGAVATFKELTV